MAIPGFQSIMLPLLKLLSDNKERVVDEIVNSLGKHFSLTQEEMEELLKSGVQARFRNRVGWARTHLKMAGLVTTPRRGIVTITERGQDVLKENLKEINMKFLDKYPEYIEFRNRTRPSGSQDAASDEQTVQTPQETIESSFLNLRADLAHELLEKIKKCRPGFFEQLVVDVFLAMGYGKLRNDAGRTTGKPGDGGIDGIIDEDKLGLDVIYTQAKRWDSQVQVKDVRDFAGALLGKKARKGIFVTTSSFSQPALDYVRNLEHKIILIDGVRLADLMIEYNVGVAKKQIFEIKKIDSDYFTEE